MLVVGQLKTKGSYAKDLEYPADEAFDTCQFFFDEASFWRVRTFAVDHDIHVHAIDGDGDLAGKERFARDHLEQAYGDVLARIITLDVSMATPALGLTSQLALHGLAGHVVQAPPGFAFWNPDDADYRTQSEPAV